MRGRRRLLASLAMLALYAAGVAALLKVSPAPPEAPESAPVSAPQAAANPPQAAANPALARRADAAGNAAAIWAPELRRVDADSPKFPRIAADPPPAASPARPGVTQSSVTQGLEHFDMTLSVPGDVAVLDSATFVAEGKTYRFAALDPIERERICTAGSGDKLACGLWATIALRNAIAGKSLPCRRLGQQGETTLIECGVGGTAVTVQMARNGWAKAASDAPPAVVAAAAAAKASSAGLWAETAQFASGAAPAPVN